MAKKMAKHPKSCLAMFDLHYLSPHQIVRVVPGLFLTMCLQDYLLSFSCIISFVAFRYGLI